MTTRQNTATEDLSTLTQDAGDMVGSSSDMSHERFGAAREQLDHAMEQGKQLYANLREATTKQAKVADEFVRNNPYKAVGIVAGIAVVIGLLINRRR
jgi:ElaB/YqjD/DUF883 family membrane-anchored ribosome-binding protein